MNKKAFRMSINSKVFTDKFKLFYNMVIKTYKEIVKQTHIWGLNLQVIS